MALLEFYVLDAKAVFYTAFSAPLHQPCFHSWSPSASSEQSCEWTPASKAKACIYHFSPTLWLLPYHEVETGLDSMACWGGRAVHLWKWLMTPLFSVALQHMLVDSGSPGEADTLAVQVVCTICLLCAGSRLLLGASLILGFVTPC